MHPERIESMFLCSPIGSMTYTEPWNAYAIDMENNEIWFDETKTAEHVRRTAAGEHAFAHIHKMAPWVQKFGWGIAGSFAMAKFAKRNKGNNSKELIKANEMYWTNMCMRPGAADITMEVPFRWAYQNIHPMTAPETRRIGLGPSSGSRW